MTDESIRKAVTPKPSDAIRNEILDDEKATARSKHDRVEADDAGAPLGDALALGGGQQSSPFQLATQADAIAKQSKRSKT